MLEHMTLRLRLVLGLVVLVTAGLAVFGVATYQLYSRSQYGRLDDQLRGSAAAAGASPGREAGLDDNRPGSGFGDGPHGPGGKDGDGQRDGHPPTVVPYGTYSELR